MYEIGRVYIWQNVKGKYAHYNGKETTVIGPPVREWSVEDGTPGIGQKTDTEFAPGRFAFASAGDLRPKNQPPGEQKIRSMFEPKPVMEVA